MVLKIFAVLTVVTAAVSGVVYQNNPILFGAAKKDYAFYDYSVYDHYPHLDDELFPLASSIGKDLGAYRNHCLRVLTFTKYFLPESTEQTLPDAMDLAATAIAYLRIGLWTDKNQNYIESSKDQLEAALGDSFSAEQMDIMREIILQQHKISDYTDMSSEEANSLVNAVRKASWTDATMGLFRFDLPPSLLETAYDQVEEAGFHAMIFRRIANLSPGIMSGVMEAGKIIKW